MSRHARPRSHNAPLRAARRRLLAVVATAGLLTAAGCGDDDDGGSTSDRDDGQTPQEETTERAIASMELCNLVDLDPVVLGVMQGQYQPEFPASVGLGAGTDGGATKCNAVFELPEIITGGVRMSGSGTLLAGVVPYPTVADATAGFDERWNEGTVQRLEEIVADEPGAVIEPEDLAGPWDRGSLLVSPSGASVGVYALAQQGSYLLKVQLVYDSDLQEHIVQGYPFSLDDIRAACEQLVLDIHTAVAPELGGQGA